MPSITLVEAQTIIGAGLRAAREEEHTSRWRLLCWMPAAC